MWCHLVIAARCDVMVLAASLQELLAHWCLNISRQ